MPSGMKCSPPASCKKFQRMADQLEPAEKYRFTLQWGAETTEKTQADDLLKSLGNRKSEFIVMAIAEYLAAHPETLSPAQKIKIIVKPSFTKEQIESIVRNIIETKFTGASEAMPNNKSPEGVLAEIKDDLDLMIQNLDLFI